MIFLLPTKLKTSKMILLITLRIVMIESFPLFKKLSYISKLSSQTKNFKIFKRALTILNGMRQRLANDIPSSVFYDKFQIHLWDDIQQMTNKFILLELLSLLFTCFLNTLFFNILGFYSAFISFDKNKQSMQLLNLPQYVTPSVTC